MKNKLLRWLLLGLAVLVLTALLIGKHYVLSTRKLDEAIAREIPQGAPKAQVIQFVEARHPVAFDDFGSEVKAKFSGLAENMVYKKDVVLTFQFGPDGNLSSYSMKEILTFF